MSKSLYGKRTIHVAVIALLGLLVYSNTFHVPFQWDEKELIKDNPIIKDLGYFVWPARAEGLEYYEAFKSRYVGYLTFALNYRLHGFEVTGYHVFNTVVHVMNALLLYLLVLLMYETPFLRESPMRRRSGLIALFSGLLFVAHPVQTEAVTYIFQRLASLVTFFYIGSLVFYAKWRGSRTPCMGQSPKVLLYFASFLCAVLAMKTKENAFTLPLIIALYEYFFFKAGRLRLHLIPFLLALFIIPLSLKASGVADIVGGNITAISFDGRVIARGDYLLTQLGVIAKYIRLLFLPVNQNVDYDYPLYSSFLSPRVFAPFLFILLILLSGVLLFSLSKRRRGLRPVAFGIFFFFVTVSVESSVLPLPMLISEYRAYLPSAGAAVSVATAMFLLFEIFRSAKLRAAAAALFIAVPVVLSLAAYSRNGVWKSEVGLWEDVTRKSPRKARGHFNLAVAYMSEGPPVVEKAIEHYRTAINIRPDFLKAHINLGIAYNNIGLTDMAIDEYMAALRLKHDSPEVHNNLGNAFDEKGLTDRAIEHYNYAIKLMPDYGAAHYNIAIAYESKGLMDKAAEHYRMAEKLKFRNSAD